MVGGHIDHLEGLEIFRKLPVLELYSVCLTKVSRKNGPTLVK